MKRKKKTKKYYYGTGRQGLTRTYIESPDNAIYENQIDMAKASYEVDSNPIVQGLNLLGNLAILYAGSKDPVGGTVGNTLKAGVGLADFFALGGLVNNVPVEVEGKEVAETPQGQVVEFKGKSHEQGGIDIDLPEGTEIFSKRIKVYGVSMADRKKKRERKELNLKRLLEKNKYDMVNKNTLKRVKEINKKEEEFDSQIQQLISTFVNKKKSSREKHGLGDIVGKDRRRPKYEKWLLEQAGISDYDFSIHKMAGGGYDYDEFIKNVAKPSYETWVSMWKNNDAGNEGIEPTKEIYENLYSKDYMNKDLSLKAFRQNTGLGKFLENEDFGTLGNMTSGDWLSMTGNVISAFGPMLNTKKNRSVDTPNINHYKDFGNDALEAISQAQDYIAGQRDNSLMDLQSSLNSSISRNRNTARGVNTIRALDLASSVNYNKARKDTYDMFSSQMLKLLDRKANLENIKDSMVMKGEEKRDLANRQDLDNYYTQLTQDILSMGEGLQHIGKNLNTAKLNEVVERLLSQLNKYGITVDDLMKFDPKKKKDKKG